jgi:hypothetical protein
MSVDISNVLHVLAHELRTPTGIAQGYLRMLAENRLTDPAERARAIEQTQQALGRVSEITRESSRLAAWLEQTHEPAEERIDARLLIEGVIADASRDTPLASSVDARVRGLIRTSDARALSNAIVMLVKATARELRKQPCAIAARVQNGAAIDVFMGLDDQFAALSAGPTAPGAGPLPLERGGLGLSLVFAVAVLDTHRATAWTVNRSRGTVGIRLPIEERAHL